MYCEKQVRNITIRAFVVVERKHFTMMKDIQLYKKNNSVSNLTSEYDVQTLRSDNVEVLKQLTDENWVNDRQSSLGGPRDSKREPFELLFDY